MGPRVAGQIGFCRNLGRPRVAAVQVLQRAVVRVRVIARRVASGPRVARQRWDLVDPHRGCG